MSQSGTLDDVPQPQGSSQSIAVATSECGRQRQKITELEEKLQVLESGQAAKQRYEHHTNISSSVHSLWL
jgi:hypothetical protein